jgi:LuxR family transcriptional regulator, maltose regulon positive regulatory protein
LSTPPVKAASASAVPTTRDRLVGRDALVEELMRSRAPVITLLAPPGYGKTTLLAQWSERLGARVAWVSCGRAHNDPVALWRDLLAALDRIAPVSPQATALLASSGGGVEAVPQLVAAIGGMPRPVTVMLDHLENVTSPECTTSIAEFALRVPDGWRLAIASRDSLPIPVSKLRMDSRILEIGVDHLAMTSDEAAALLRRAGADVSAAEVDQLVTRTEGWAAGLYLAALAIQSGAPATGFSFTGDDRLVEDYLRSELLDRMSHTQVSFLVRTSILDRMTGPLCDAVTGGKRSARMLEELERRNLLVVPLDRRGEWYRYHHLLRELLRAELRRDDPAVVQELHCRAADWYEANGMVEIAIDHADAAGDSQRLARLVLELMQPVWASGRVETVRGWMDRLDTKAHVPYHAAIAAHGALIFALLGRQREADRWVGVAESLPTEGTLPDGSTVAATLAYLRAVLGRDGPAAMRTDAAFAFDGLSPTTPYRATMLLYEGLSWQLGGDLDRADGFLARSYDAAVAFGAEPLAALILAEKALNAAERGQWARVSSLLGRALELVERGHLETYWSSALVFAGAARAAAHRGEMREARQFVRRAAQLRPLLTHVLPVVSVQTLIELARTYLALVDPTGAVTVLEQAQDILRRRPELGILPQAVEELKQRVDQITRAEAFGASSLTAAELRLVPLLPTHLSLPQIAGRLYVSPHTVKAQVKSIYRKLGVSSRGAVVDLIVDLDGSR